MKPYSDGKQPYNASLMVWRPFNIGVPQGSVLGPLLFMLFVNDLPQYIVNGRCSRPMCAGDTMLYCYGVDVPGVISSPQQCLNCASRWYTANRLISNTAKCSVMLFGASIDDKEKSKLQTLYRKHGNRIV